MCHSLLWPGSRWVCVHNSKFAERKEATWEDGDMLKGGPVSVVELHDRDACEGRLEKRR